MSRLEEHEIESLTLILRKLFMTDIADNVIALEAAVTTLTAQVTALATLVATISAPDLSGLNAKLDTIIGDLNPTVPVSPTAA